MKFIKAFVWSLIIVSCSLWLICNGPDDGGWYLNASKKVASGLIPHRDFIFPQGPLMAYCFALPAKTANPVLWGRILASVLSLFGIFFFCRVLEKENPGSELLFLIGILAFPLSMSFLTLVKTHSPVIFLLGLAIFLSHNNRDFLAVIVLGMAASLRLSLTPFWLAYTAFALYQKRKLIMPAFLLVVAAFLGWCVFTDWKILEQLFLPFGFYQPNEVTRSFSLMKGQLATFAMLIRKPLTLVRCFLSFPMLVFYFFAPTRQDKKTMHWFAGSLILFVSHLLADRTYEEYQIPAILLLLFALCLRLDLSAKPAIPKRKVATALLVCFLLPWLRVADWANKSSYTPFLVRLKQQSAYLNNILPAGDFLPYDAYLALYCQRNIENSAWIGQFSFLPEASDKFVAKYQLHNRKTLQSLLNNSQLQAVYSPDQTMGKNQVMQLLKANKRWQQCEKLPAIFPDSAFLFIRKEKANGNREQ